MRRMSRRRQHLLSISLNRTRSTRLVVVAGA